MSFDLPPNPRFDNTEIDSICLQLKSLRPEATGANFWPQQQLESLCRLGATRLLLSHPTHGKNWPLSDQLHAITLFSEACLSATFVFTQHLGALRRLVSRDDSPLFNRRILDYISGDRFVSLGLSHLHNADVSSLTAEFVQGGVLLNGRIPWVTGAGHVHDIYVGARLPDKRSLFLLCPMTPVSSIAIESPQSLVALSETATSGVVFERHFVPSEYVVNVGDDARFGLSTGGATSCAMALGHAMSALNAMASLTTTTSSEILTTLLDRFRQEWLNLFQCLLNSSEALPILRAKASEMALRYSQSFLIMQKGSGFKQGALAQTLCRQALFFLVWSNPQSTSLALLQKWSTHTDQSA